MPSQLLNYTVKRKVPSLRETGTLPSVCGTRQSPKYTRQRLCRVPHSAKALPRALGKKLISKKAFAECFLSGTQKAFVECRKSTRQNENAKKPKNNSKIFFRGRPPPVNARLSPSKSLHFLRKIHG